MMMSWLRGGEGGGGGGGDADVTWRSMCEEEVGADGEGVGGEERERMQAHEKDPQENERGSKPP